MGGARSAWLQVNNMDVVPRLLGTSMEFLHSYMAAYVPALGVRALTAFSFVTSPGTCALWNCLVCSSAD